MSDIKKLLETMDRMSTVERKPSGPKFPGYWKGTDPASKAKDKMVGGCEESIIKDLNKISKEKVTEWQLQEKFDKFKEQQSYTGIDPTVRQRMGMPAATADEIRSYIEKNPPAIKAGDGYLTTNTGVGLDPNKPVVPEPVLSGGQLDVIRAAANAAGIGPDKKVDLTSTPSAVPTAAAPPPISRNAPVGSAALDPTLNPDSATSIPGGQSAGGAGVVPTKSISSIPIRSRNPTAGSWQDIWKNNPNIKNPNLIYPGQEIKLPNGTSAIVDKGDTLSSIADRYKQGGYNTGTEVGPSNTSPAPATTRAPATAPAARSAPAASRPQPRAVPPTSFDPPGPDTDTSDRPVPAVRNQPAAPANAATPRTAHTPGTRVTTQIRDPQDPNKPLSIQLKKGDDGSWYDDRGRKLNFNKPGDLEKLENLPADAPTFMDKMKRVLGGELPSRAFGQPKPQQNQPAPATQPPARPATQPAAPRSNSSSSKTDQSGMASYATKGGRVYAADFNNPSGLGWDGKGKYTSYKTPEEGVNATKDLVSRYLTDRTPYIKGPATPEQVVSTWVTGGKTPADKIQGGRYLQSVKDELAAAGVKLDAKGRIPHSQAATDAITRAIVRHETSPKHMEKFAPFLTAPKDGKGSIEESNKEDEKIAGRYDPDEFDLMVKRLGQRAREQDRKHGPVDIAALAKRLRAIEKREQTKEQEDPAVNMQDPDVQRTSQTSPQQDPAAVRQQQLDQTVDLATAKGTMSGLKTALGPDVDTNALASAVTKISDGKPLTGPESTSMSALTPLISKAAETPQTAMALKTALSNAGMLAKQGK
jgi:LysM repeat protein